jgi:SAM-dependent methyltransferase
MSVSVASFDFFQGLGVVLGSCRAAGVLDVLADGGRDLGSVASELKLDPRTLGLAVDVLEAAGFVARDEQGRVGLTPERRHVVRLPDPWAHFPEMLRTGAPLPLIDDHARRGESYRDVVAWLGRRFSSSAKALASRLGPLEGPSPTILDVGAGSGVWSLAMAEEDARAHVIALDLPEVVPRFLERAAALGLAGRARAVAGDFHRDCPAGEGEVARVVLGAILHLESADDAARLVTRCARSLEPGGRMVIIEAICGDTPEQALGRALYALHLGLRTQRGAAWRLDDVLAWCALAGLEHEAVIPFESQPGLGALVCRRRR